MAIKAIATGGGGIIKCDEANFINNRRAVEFGSYQLADNISEFVNSTFTVDDDYVGGFWDHALLQEVSGVRFKGCDFVNERESPGGYGIRAVDADFVVEAYCEEDNIPCNPNDWDRSRFSRFWAAIDVSMSGCFLYTYQVDRSDFSLNAIGINSNAVNMPLITRNTFDIGVDNTAFFQPTGIRINGGTGYTIQENDFSGIPFNVETIGVNINETGSADNEVRRNRYDNLYIGNLSNGDNRNETFFLDGLHFYCNENSGNTFDIAVPFEPNNPDTEYGIAQNQGAVAEAAGNAFSQSGNNPESDFFNQSDWTINYFFLDDPIESEQFPTYHSDLLNAIGTDNANGCDILYTPLVEPGPGKETTIRTEYWNARQTRDNLKQNWINQIDGGNTDILVNQLMMSASSGGSELAQDLLNKSPWLSQSVLKSAADQTDVLDHATMYDILLANPDESKNEDLLTFLTTKAEPMPTNMIESLRNASFNATSRTHLEAELSYYNSKVVSAAARLTHYFMTDAQAKNRDSVRVWLAHQENMEADMAIVETWLHEGNTTRATQILNEIPQQHQMSAKQLLEFNYFRNLKNTQISLIQEGKCVYDLDISEIDRIIDLAENSRGIAGIQAKNILNNGFDYAIYDEPILPDLGQLRKNLKTAIPEALKVYAFPNPASAQVQFHFQLDKVYPNMSIQITNARGEQVNEILLEGKKEGFATWKADLVKSGVYFYSICSNGHPIDTGKLIIAR